FYPYLNTTSRASRGIALVPATRRQDASKFGQACFEQLLPIGRISRRSPLVRATGTDASTCGAKPGRTVSAAAMKAAMAIAERALIMMFPCYFEQVLRTLPCGPLPDSLAPLVEVLGGFGFRDFA